MVDLPVFRQEAVLTRGRGGYRGGGFISWENFVFKEGVKIVRWPNLGVAALWGQPACPPRAAWGEWGAFIRPWPWWALLKCCLGGRMMRPPWQGPSAALCRLQPVARPALTCAGECPCIVPHSAPATTNSQ